jgi:hypothetical protein
MTLTVDQALSILRDWQQSAEPLSLFIHLREFHASLHVMVTSVDFRSSDDASLSLATDEGSEIGINLGEVRHFRDDYDHIKESVSTHHYWFSLTRRPAKGRVLAGVFTSTTRLTPVIPFPWPDERP